MFKSTKAKSDSLYGHLEELRRTLLASLLAVFLGAVFCYVFFLGFLTDILLCPIQSLGKDLVFIGVGEGFITHIKIAFLGGMIISSPVILWELLKYISPALYRNEKRTLYIALFCSTLLLIIGIVFAYCCILPVALKMLLVNLSFGLTPMISIGAYVSFLFWFLLPFGLIFETPLAVYFLSKIGLVTPNLLVAKRKNIIFALFVLAAILTPTPDIITQLLMAVPMLILYQISVWISKWVAWSKKKKNEKLAEERAV